MMYPSIMIPSQSVVLRGVMAEGLSKLLLSGRVISHRLLVRLLLLWYNPILQEEDELREVLGTFFTTYSATDRCCTLLHTIFVKSSIQLLPSGSSLFSAKKFVSLMLCI